MQNFHVLYWHIGKGMLYLLMNKTLPHAKETSCKLTPVPNCIHAMSLCISTWQQSYDPTYTKLLHFSFDHYSFLIKLFKIIFTKCALHINEPLHWIKRVNDSTWRTHQTKSKIRTVRYSIPSVWACAAVASTVLTCAVHTTKFNHQ